MTETTYEWILQELDEGEDVLENYFCDSLAEALEQQSSRGFTADNSLITLCRTTWLDGSAEQRMYADYTPAQPAKLAPSFTDYASHTTNVPVPKRFLSEVK